MTPNYLTIAEAAKELSKQLERPVTERQVLAYGENEQISIFAKINGNARFVRLNPIEGEDNAFQAVNRSLPRLSSSAITSLLLTGQAQYKEHTNREQIGFFGHKEWATVVTYKIADGETPPKTTIADCRISQASIDKIVDDELLVAVLEWEGKTTHYNYWLKLAILTPHEAIMLLNFCHPQRPLNTFSKVDPAKREHYEKLESELTQAERAQTAGIVPANASPQDWLNWANKNNFNVPTQFNAILCKPPIELEAFPQNLDTVDKPWLIANSSDPVAAYSWYIPARYFARETLKTEPTLLAKKSVLAGRVNVLFKKYEIKKRGGVNNFDDSTIKKAFTNVNFG